MGKNNRFKAKNTGNFKRGKKSLQIRKDGLKPKKYIVFSLKYLDKTQGQTPKLWENEKILAKAINRFQVLCSMTIIDATQQQILKIYGTEIPKDSEFSHPNYLDEDIEWASIRIQAKERIIGFIESGFVFHIVFFDMEHEFYPSKKKNT
ncbi:MAG: hypothetical protein ACPGTO_08710 [Polaribacter sp.]